MELTTSWESAGAGPGRVPVYLARPAATSAQLPGILVLMEVWGVDEHIQDVVRRFATAGYVAAAPDLYSLGGETPESLRPERIEAVKEFRDSIPHEAWMDPGQRQAALDRLTPTLRDALAEAIALVFSPERDWATLVGAMRAAVAFLGDHPACAGLPVGAVGYCLGGRLAAELACAEPALSAAVMYYGSPPPLEQIAGIGCPLLGIYGEDDPRIMETLPGFREALEAAGKDFAYHVYPGAPHAFFNDTRLSYDIGASRDAWARTLSFLADRLT